MAARDKNIFSILQSGLNLSYSDDDDESAGFSEDEYVSSDESDSGEKYTEKNLHCREEEFEPEDGELLNEEECLHAIH